MNGKVSYDVSIEAGRPRAFFVPGSPQFNIGGKLPSMSGPKTSWLPASIPVSAHGGHFAMKEKRCTKCGIIKSRKEFPVKRNRSDGLDSWCRECNREKNRQAYRKNSKKQIANNRKRWKENPSLRLARDAINNRVKRGTFNKPNIYAYKDISCVGRLEAHHWHGYDEAHKLDVIWLCASHHKRLHKKEKQLNDTIG